MLSSILINHSQLINPLPLVSLIRYTLSISLLQCSAPCIIINFLVLLSKLFNSRVFHFRIHAPYLITETTQVLTAITLFLPSNFDHNVSLNRHRSYQFTISLSMYNQSHQCTFMCCPFGSLLPSALITFPLFLISTPHFLI